MPNRIRDLTGQTFNRLTVLRLSHTKKNAFWTCRCECGNEHVVRSSHLTSGQVQSCGCVRVENGTVNNAVHGHNRNARPTRTYNTWVSMKKRCFSVKSPDYARYGGRGITVCDRWQISFENFLEDMGERPPGHTIDRQDNDGNYEPGNCRWATSKQQSANRRISKRKLTDA